MSKHRIPNEKWMEFIDEITTQMTEITFNEPYREIKNDLDNHTRFIFTDEAQDFYNERYDEVETLLENTLDITNDKPEYYEGQ
tara:strand:+ start:221 stop:469 length:249 start_codon:yes stop_codon:yes gene_type:complete